MSLSIWVVYKHPADFPTQYVARLFKNETATNVKFIGNTLDDVRDQLPQSLARLSPHPRDEPHIVETWL